MGAGFPVVLQAVGLAAIVGLAVNGLGVGADLRGDQLTILRKTNLTTLAVWGLWWPGMIAVAILFGRAWCTVCPMELVNRVGHAVSRKLGWQGARLGKLLRAGWVTVLLYLVLQLLVAGIALHRVPHFTAIMLLGLVGLALVVGVVFREHRSFCTAFCPASALLSVYGRYTPLQLEARRRSVCRDCATKDCVRDAHRDRFDRRSCPSLLVPYRRGPSDGCVLCLQCVKICPHDNMGIGLVSARAPIRKGSLLRPFEAAFVTVALGFVAHEVIGEVKWLDAMFHSVPARLDEFLPSASFGWLEALWFLVLFPLGVWAAIAAVSYGVGQRTGVRSLLLAAATRAAPVVAAAHLAKAAAKMSSWGGFLPVALGDPRGLDTLAAISQDALVPPAGLLDLPVVGGVMLGATMIIAVRGWRRLPDMVKGSAIAARAGLLGSSLLFASVLVTWVEGDVMSPRDGVTFPTVATPA